MATLTLQRRIQAAACRNARQAAACASADRQAADRQAAVKVASELGFLRVRRPLGGRLDVARYDLDRPDPDNLLPTVTGGRDELDPKVGVANRNR